MIIEFVGLPGSGKTTICRYMGGSSWVEGATLVPTTNSTFGSFPTSHLPFFRRKLVAIWRVLRSLVEQPRGSFSLLLFGLSRWPLASWKIGQTFSGISMLPRIADERKIMGGSGKVLMFEQGMVQLFGSLALPGRADRETKPEVVAREVVPGLIDGLIWIDCPLEMALGRVRDRKHGRSRFDSWDDEQAMDHLPVMLRVLEGAVRAAEEAGVPVLRLDAKQPLEANSQRIAEWVSALRSLAAPDRS